MQTLDIVIFTIILTAVSLAGAQSALLNLSDKADEVPLVNKIIGMLGLGSAGFALFFSRRFMGEVESAILMLLVLVIAFVTWLTRKIKNARGPQPEKLPIPDTAISSLEPNP